MRAFPFRLLPLLLAVLASAADARPPLGDQDEVRLLLAQGYTLDEAVNMARRRYPGKVLSAETVQQGDRPVHRIRIIEDGRVRGLRYDGTTGQPIPRARDQEQRGPGARHRGRPSPDYRPRGPR
jgi:hypothetical protein